MKIRIYKKQLVKAALVKFSIGTDMNGDRKEIKHELEGQQEELTHDQKRKKGKNKGRKEERI